MEEDKCLEYKLIEAEQRILKTLTSYKTEFVPIKSTFGSDEKMWTISLNTESPNTPLVMLHGFAAALGFWSLNFEPLSKNRPVYAMDLLGFGRSSRPEFSKDYIEAETQMIDAIEEWRKKLKLEKLILLGHSMGAYLAALYAISYPDRVEHLIFVDAWGFSDKYDNPPLSFKILGYIFQNYNPLNTLRSMGPYWGPLVLRKTRYDIFGKISEKINDETTLPTYLYYCNASKNPTGESFFYSLVLGIGWAKKPIIKRIDNLKKDIPMTFLYGSKTWMDTSMGQRIKEMRPNSYVHTETIENSHHHIYSEQADEFNELVIKACDYVPQEKL